MCLRLARLFGNSPELWMRLQVAYDIKKAEQNKAVMK
jgi:plasmid maintenance system antidote protein VapI